MHAGYVKGSLSNQECPEVKLLRGCQHILKKVFAAVFLANLCSNHLHKKKQFDPVQLNDHMICCFKK